MTTYLSLQTALQMWESAYTVSALLLIGVSYLGLTAIASTKKTNANSTLPKRFT